MSSLVDLLEGPPDETLVFAGDTTVTRGELRVRADELADVLREAGVEPGTPVGVMLDNGPETVAALFGVWRTGAVHLPLNPRLTDPEIEHVLHEVPPAAIVTRPGHSGRFEKRGLILWSGDCWELAAPADRVSAMDRGVALTSFTSGTTGRPKAVLLRHDGILTLIDGVLAKLRGGRPGSNRRRDRPPMPNLVPVSLSLWAGIYTVLFALRTGAPIVLMERFDPREFAQLVGRHQLRSTVLPPAAMTMLVDDPEVTDLAPLRYVRSITAPLSPLQARRFHDKFGVRILNGYGQTELGGEVIGWNAQDSRRFGDDKLGSVGRPHQGVELRITDGELWVRAPAMSAGYAGGADLGDRVSDDGFLRTGDMARIDDDGFVWIEGRASDMINRGGLKVFPDEVEEVLRLDPSVADAAVVGVPDDRLGEVPWAFVEPATGPQVPGPPDPLRLEATCRAHLAPYKVPVGYDVISELPRNEVGKVRRAELAPDLTPER